MRRYTDERLAAFAAGVAKAESIGLYPAPDATLVEDSQAEIANGTGPALVVAIDYRPHGRAAPG